MRNLIIYLSVLIFSFASKMLAQTTFENKAKVIAEKIDNSTRAEKALLKSDIEDVNRLLETGAITLEQANEKKKKLAEARALNIENNIASAQEELKELVQQKVDGKIDQQDVEKPHGTSIVLGGSTNDSIKGREINLTALKVYENNKEKRERLSKRTTSQLVFATGLNNLTTNGNVNNSDFRYWGSHFYEWGLTYNSRILKDYNLLHGKYGLSLMYNNLRPTDNRVFVKNGDKTDLQVSTTHLDDSRFRNVYLVAPLHLEFDFSKNKSKDGKSFFQSHESVRLGLGGYAGFRLKSKQFQLFDDANGHDVTVKEKGDFNVNNFIYGVSAYIGYKETSLYVKYDLNPIFESNVVKQNNISLGVRFDFN